MGVHGLTTFLQENKRLLSSSFQSTPNSPEPAKIPVIVDGWSFIYKLYQDSNLPWVYGGEYPEFSGLVKRTIQAWLDVGFELYFVFDGPCPEIKFPTVALRLSQSQIQHSLLFFRTSVSSRSMPRFLNETRILPPLAHSTCLQTLLSIAQNSDNLQVHFADEEGDPFAVELAGRVGGYVIGNDSDFVILNSEGYKGYIPLGEMVWLAAETQDLPLVEDPDREFHTVRKPKAKKRGTNGARIGKGIIPSNTNAQPLILAVTTYSPEVLATHLKIPVTLLPLLGALVGNDFTSRSESPRRNIQSLFFDRHLTLCQRVERAASTIHRILNPDPHNKRLKHHVDSVMDLIDRTVNALLARWATTMSSGEIDKIIEGVVNATLQYAIPKYQGIAVGGDSLWPTEVCALHNPETCPLLPMISHLLGDEEAVIQEADEDTRQRIELRGMYLAAYRKGLLSEKTMDTLSTASYWPRLFLENPDVETVGRSIGRAIRLWTYAVLADVVGLPTRSNTMDELPIPGQASTSDITEGDAETAVVAETHSEDEGPDVDLLAPLKGELQRLQSPHQESKNLEEVQIHSSPSILIEKRAPGVLKVTEHIRRGTRIAEETIEIMPLTDLLSSVEVPYVSRDSGKALLLGPQSDALTVLLRAVGSDTPMIRELTDEQLTVAISLRWVVHALQKRAEESMSKERSQERWTEREARCFLAAFAWSSETCNSDTIDEVPPMTDRNIQLTAQILMSLDTVSEFAGVLLIANLVPAVSRHFSGKKFHALLTGRLALDENAVPGHLWTACQDGLECAFLEDKKKIEKRMKKAVVALPVPTAAPRPQGRSLFALLAEGTA